MPPLLERLRSQARDDIAIKVAALTRELEERIDRELPPTPTDVPAPEDEEDREQVGRLLEELSGAESSARSSAKEALRSWLGGLKGELEEGAMGMLDTVSGKNPKAFDGSLAPDQENLLFEKVAEGVRQTVDVIIAGEREVIERQIASLKRPR